MNRIVERNGMTAVEVLAATLLASLMLGSVVGVLGGLGRQQKAIASHSHQPEWHDRFADQLQWDLCNSCELIDTTNGLRLIGVAGRDYTNGAPTGRPTAIDYFLLEGRHGSLLVRRETHMDTRTNDNWRTELVCQGVGRIEFGNRIYDRPTGGMPVFSVSEPAAPMPITMSIRVFQVGEVTPSFDRQFVLR